MGDKDRFFSTLVTGFIGLLLFERAAILLRVSRFVIDHQRGRDDTKHVLSGILQGKSFQSHVKFLKRLAYWQSTVKCSKGFCANVRMSPSQSCAVYLADFGQ